MSATGGDSVTMPLFPLHAVLFPEGRLPLRIFEVRYIDMVRRCLRTGSPFGVVLIQAGSEVEQEGSMETCFHPVGTEARIVDSNIHPDGLLGIEAQGSRRFEVVRHWQEGDGLFMAEVRWLADKARVENLSEATINRHRLFLERVIEANEARWPLAERRLDDPVWVAYRLSELLPVRLRDRQSILAASCLDSATRAIDQLIDSLGIA